MRKYVTYSTFTLKHLQFNNFLVIIFKNQFITPPKLNWSSFVVCLAEKSLFIRHFIHGKFFIENQPLFLFQQIIPLLIFSQYTHFFNNNYLKQEIIFNRRIVKAKISLYFSHQEFSWQKNKDCSKSKFQVNIKTICMIHK